MQYHPDSHARIVNIYTDMKLLFATAALQWWQQADKHLNNCRASKEYHTPPLSKVDHLCNEHHNNFILVDWSKPVKSVHILLFDHHTTPAVPWTDPKLYQCHYHYYINGNGHNNRTQLFPENKLLIFSLPHQICNSPKTPNHTILIMLLQGI